ncbi:hypothetical protein K402DRAFT_401582 [Aulographum hederae CBS 113979]|uniref:Uncharacterized protein n=1 Tax=Aulographum hederae CBS 113979 TaxID=1176131 RepID=A0A6G1HAS4_9PEZI|nr:hypothetical protein K402DRAFT_401582 [Aulographum hederae CBS 113979]
MASPTSQHSARTSEDIPVAAEHTTQPSPKADMTPQPAAGATPTSRTSTGSHRLSATSAAFYPALFGYGDVRSEAGGEELEGFGSGSGSRRGENPGRGGGEGSSGQGSGAEGFGRILEMLAVPNQAQQPGEGAGAGGLVYFVPSRRNQPIYRGSVLGSPEMVQQPLAIAQAGPSTPRPAPVSAADSTPGPAGGGVVVVTTPQNRILSSSTEYVLSERQRLTEMIRRNAEIERQVEYQGPFGSQLEEVDGLLKAHGRM